MTYRALHVSMYYFLYLLVLCAILTEAYAVFFDAARCFSIHIILFDVFFCVIPSIIVNYTIGGGTEPGVGGISGVVG